MSLHRAAIGLLLILLTPCSSQQISFKYNNDPLVIRDVLRNAHVSGSLIFSGGCKFQDRSAPVPSVGRSGDFSSARETLQHMLAVNSKIKVTQDPDGMIRMKEAGVPTDILEVKIHHLSFPANLPDSFDEAHRPLYMHGSQIALETILSAPELVAFEKEHQINHFDSLRMEGDILSWSKGPEVIGELNDVTVSQALDYVLKTFPGYWVYEDASCEAGGREVRFKFY